MNKENFSNKYRKYVAKCCTENNKIMNTGTMNKISVQVILLKKKNCNNVNKG